jgi:methylthioribulose-1-phosphate dehydratase
MKHIKEREALAAIGREFHSNKWSLGTSSNYSVVLGRQPTQLLLTASGKDKGALGLSDFVVVDETGNVLDGAPEKPSAETGLHLLLTQLPKTGAVLHTHSVWGTVLSDLFASSGGFFIEGYEMLKGLDGIKTHETKKWVDIFPNDQDIPRLAGKVKARLEDSANPLAHGFLIHNHGLYTYGANLFEARRHIEIFEFLFECVARRRLLS